jgi:hypothetical protein
MPNPQAGGPALVSCPRLLIQYIHSYPPYLKAVSSIRNLRMHHAMVTRDHLILLGDFSAKIGREDIFKPTIENESLHEISNDEGFRVVNFATSKYLIFKSTMFPHRDIHTYTWTSPDIHNQIDHILIDGRRHPNILDVRLFRAADRDTDHCLVVAKVREI